MGYVNPSIVEERKLNVVTLDAFSRLLMDRIVFLGTEIDDDVANIIISQLLYLDAQSHDLISIYINTPGGSVSAGLAIYDVIKLLKSPVQTICVGNAASMGSIILCAGSERAILAHGRVLIHQPNGFVGGQTTDIVITVKEFEKDKKILTQIISERTGHPFEKVAADMERDYWMDAEEALAYNIVDKILVSKI